MCWLTISAALINTISIQVVTNAVFIELYLTAFGKNTKLIVGYLILCERLKETRSRPLGIRL